MLINVSYVHSLELLERMGSVFGIEVSAVEEWDVADLMRDLSPEDAAKFCRGFKGIDF